MAGKIILVTGGARSGKSAFAEKLAASGKKVAYIATAQVFDEEMAFRVKRHKSRRPANWSTIEAPTAVVAAIEEVAKTADTILFDCITLYLSNLLCALPEAKWQDETAVYELATEKIKQLLAAAQKAANQGVRVILVSNEVGAGIVPENKLARLYRDVSGLVNQQIASEADQVLAVIAGIPIDIKALAYSE